MMRQTKRFIYMDLITIPTRDIIPKRHLLKFIQIILLMINNIFFFARWTYILNGEQMLMYTLIPFKIQ